MTRRGSLLLLVLAACAPSNEGLLAELERGGAARPELERLLDGHPGPVPLVRAGGPVTLPMARGKIPTVTGRINGVEMPIVLDTGTSHVMISGEAARDARVYVPARETVEIVSPGYTAAHRACAFETLELGGHRLGPGVATVPVRKTSHHRWAGLGSDAYAIVGCAVLSHFRVTFDFERREIRLVPHGGPASTRLVPAPVEINGRAYYLLVDSGAADLVLEPWAARELGLIDDAAYRSHARPVKREWEVVTSHLDPVTVQVRGRTFRDVRAVAVRTFGEERAEEVVIGGLLGLRAFGPRAWTLDYGRRRLE